MLLILPGSIPATHGTLSLIEPLTVLHLGPSLQAAPVLCRYGLMVTGSTSCPISWCFLSCCIFPSTSCLVIATFLLVFCIVFSACEAEIGIVPYHTYSVGTVVGGKIQMKFVNSLR